ncbi:hypothetical protein BYT27DRAFT_7194897 [Phlegmacium glaucopus]|nr:hypothetical protein BYT27DRAFT_7194897 [Phlegmacium glaucopus]
MKYFAYRQSSLWTSRTSRNMWSSCATAPPFPFSVAFIVYGYSRERNKRVSFSRTFVEILER